MKQIRKLSAVVAYERRTSAVRGVISDGFMTIVQPTASAGAIFHALDSVRTVLAEFVKNTRRTTFQWDSSMEFCGASQIHSSLRAGLLRPTSGHRHQLVLGV